MNRHTDRDATRHFRHDLSDSMLEQLSGGLEMPGGVARFAALHGDGPGATVQNGLMHRYERNQARARALSQPTGGVQRFMELQQG